MNLEQKATFAVRLSELREQKDLTQQELANEIGIQRVTIAKYESQKRIPSYEDLTAFAKYFDTSTDYLLGLTNVARVETPEDEKKKIACDYIGLSEKAVETFIDEMNALILLYTPEDHPETQYKIVNKILSSENFYPMVHYLFNLIICNTNYLLYSVICSERPDLSEPQYRVRNFNDECDLCRYKISRYMEKIIDLFDYRENSEKINRKDLINNSERISAFEITDKVIDDSIRYFENKLKKEASDNGKHNPEDE